MRRRVKFGIRGLSILVFVLSLITVMILSFEWANASTSGSLIDFETPILGSSARRVINPFADSSTGIVFTAEDIRPTEVEVVGLVKNRFTSACVDPPSDNQKLGTGNQVLGNIGFHVFAIRATFPASLPPPSTVSVEFQSVAGAPVRLRLFNDAGIQVSSTTEISSAADGTCGFPGNPRARQIVSASSTEPVSYAIMDIEGSHSMVFVLDNFQFSDSSAQEVSIDVKPDSDPNCINNDGKGVIPVAILSSNELDALQVDPSTVILDGQAVKAAGNGKLLAHSEDVNGDEHDDLVVQFKDIAGTYDSDSELAILTGETFDGVAIVGTDSICIVP